jgi:hypothetical protein
MPTKHRTVADFLDAQPPEVRDRVETLRSLIVEAEPRLVENIKWNSPNFSLDGQDLLTINVGRSDEVRLVLHRGTEIAENKDAATTFTGDPGGVLTWHSDIRASMPVPSEDAIEDAAAIVRAWVRAAEGAAGTAE